MTWSERNLRGTKVFARTDEGGKLVVDGDGRVDIKYKLGEAEKVYRASERNLEAGSGAPPVVDEPRAAPKKVVPGPATLVAKGDTVIIYTDGACTGNPGPMGLGAVIVLDGKRLELGEYLGVGTNNIAELTAIERAIDAIPAAAADRPILVHTDSSYAIGVLAGGFKAKKNVELIAKMRAKLARFANLRFVKVRGHAGVPENERCDELARDAVASRGRA